MAKTPHSLWQELGKIYPKYERRVRRSCTTRKTLAVGRVFRRCL